MAKALDERIAAAMSKDARIATVADLIEEVAGEIVRIQAEHERLDALSKSATAAEDEADAAADEATKLSRKIIRLSAKREQLSHRHSEIVASDRQMKLRAEYDEIKARRDELAADLAEAWPAITEEIVALIRRLQESDRECSRINGQHVCERLISAEAIARDCPPNFYFLNGGPVTRFSQIVIPSLRGKNNTEMAWPVDRPGDTIAVPVP